MDRGRIFAGALLLALGACSGNAPPVEGPRQPPAAPDTCGLADVAGFMGRAAGKLPAEGGWETIRVIRPGQAVTMDYSPTRLNVEVDGANQILRMSCG